MDKLRMLMDAFEAAAFDRDATYASACMAEMVAVMNVMIEQFGVESCSLCRKNIMHEHTGRMS